MRSDKCNRHGHFVVRSCQCELAAQARVIDMAEKAINNGYMYMIFHGHATKEIHDSLRDALIEIKKLKERR